MLARPSHTLLPPPTHLWYELEHHVLVHGEVHPAGDALDEHGAGDVAALVPSVFLLHLHQVLRARGASQGLGTIRHWVRVCAF
jgi:hypothetical protein